MQTDEMPVSTMHTDAGADVHESLAGAMRSSACGGPSVGRGQKGVYRRRRPKTGAFSSFELAEDDLGKDEPRLSQQDRACRNLIAAVIHGAIYDFWDAKYFAARGKSAKDRPDHALMSAMRSESGRWIFGPRRDAFSFDWCCLILGIQPERVRERLRTNEMTRRKYKVH